VSFVSLWCLLSLDCAGLSSQGVHRLVMCGALCLFIHSTDLHKQLWNQPVARNGMPLFSVQRDLVCLSKGQGSRMLESLIQIDALSSAYSEKKNSHCILICLPLMIRYAVHFHIVDGHLCILFSENIYFRTYAHLLSLLLF
jgi:hypothetical protein